MIKKSNSKHAGVSWGLLFLMLLFPAVMVPLTFVDIQWTVRLNSFGFDGFGDLMDRTMFMGSMPGASDPAIVFLLCNTIVYFYYSRNRISHTLDRYRPFIGFVLFCSLFTGLGLVHSIKWVWGRARPNLVFDGQLSYSHWYEFGPQLVTDGIFYGSFPSGHTATVFLPITLSYLLVGLPPRSFNQKLTGWIWGAVVLLFSLLMILGRSMTLHHWITDSVGIVLLSWFFIHLIYYRILKIPAQQRYVQVNNRYAPLPRYWELSLLWRLLFITLGVMSTVIGIRSVILGRDPWLLIIAVPGILTALYFKQSLARIYRTCMVHFRPFFADKPPASSTPESE